MQRALSNPVKKLLGLWDSNQAGHLCQLVMGTPGHNHNMKTEMQWRIQEYSWTTYMYLKRQWDPIQDGVNQLLNQLKQQYLLLSGFAFPHPNSVHYCFQTPVHNFISFLKCHGKERWYHWSEGTSVQIFGWLPQEASCSCYITWDKYGYLWH